MKRNICILFVLFTLQYISYSQTKSQIDSLFRRIYTVRAMAAAENSDIFSAVAVAVFDSNAAFDFSGINGLNYYRFDKRFILLNWGVPEEDGTVSYRGLLWGWNSSQKNYRLQILNDVSSYQSFPEKEIYTPENWWGAFYYDCIASDKSGGAGGFYTFLGWNSSQPLYSQKVIETMRIKPNGDAEFGLPVFTSTSGATLRKFNVDAASIDYYAIERRTTSRAPASNAAIPAPLSETSDFVPEDDDAAANAASPKQKPIRRIVFKFSRKHDIILRYDYQMYTDKSGNKPKQQKENMIIFDRVIPFDASLGGQAANYIPAGGIYDGFRPVNGKWQLTLNIIARNPNPKQSSKKPIRNKLR
ncbi:MAG: hypothetical protein LBC49_04980 [Bacteroidales bacterium]|jgi:hypothetical protein|nr:hypothetical protein [Bacteroidales bacterium]